MAARRRTARVAHACIVVGGAGALGIVVALIAPATVGATPTPVNATPAVLAERLTSNTATSTTAPLAAPARPSSTTDATSETSTEPSAAPSTTPATTAPKTAAPKTSVADTPPTKTAPPTTSPATTSPPAPPTTTTAPPPPQPASDANAAIRRALLDQTNDDRTARGYGRLATDSWLEAKAQAWAEQQAADGRTSHAPSGHYADWSRYQAYAENVGSGGDTRVLYLALFDSDVHRINMLNRGYDRVGIGAACRDGVLYLAIAYAASDGNPEPVTNSEPKTPASTARIAPLGCS